jgi:hypothetical protein
MHPADSIRASDAAVVDRYLHLRSLLHDRLLSRVERHILARYVVQPSRRIHSTLLVAVRAGFFRQGEGDLWPVVFLTTVDISVGLCVELSPDRVASLGTMVNGPQRIRQRGWEDWWGWERPLSQLQAGFFDLPSAQQEEAVCAWYVEGLEWLAGSGLLRRKG